jgi:hypothetical protein
MHVEYNTLEYDATVGATIDHFRSRVAVPTSGRVWPEKAKRSAI